MTAATNKLATAVRSQRARTPGLPLKKQSVKPVLVFGSSTTRPLWFDGRFLAPRDLAREQHFFVSRQAELARAGGFGVQHGLTVDQGVTVPQPATGSTLVIHSGLGTTPSGALVMLSNDMTIQLSDIADEANLDEQFGLATSPQQPSRTRTGLYVVALRPALFTANPISFYPASLESPRVSRDGDTVEGTAVTLVPYTNPVNNFDAAQQQAALARQIFVTGDTGTLSKYLLPLAMISIDRGVIQWIDPYLARRDSGPQAAASRLDRADPSVQQAFLRQYTAQLQSFVTARQTAGVKANFAATDYLQAMPPAGPLPLDAIDTVSYRQTFFPPQMKVSLNLIPEDELPAVIEDSLSLPPLDLTLPAATYANLYVYVLIAVPRAGYAGLASLAAPVMLSPVVPPLLINLQHLPPSPSPAPPSSLVWATAIKGQTYGYYLLRRSKPVFADFTTVSVPPTTTTPTPGTTPATTTTPAGTTTPAPTTTVNT